MKTVRSKLESNLGWGVLVLLLLGCLVVLWPFFSALLWAVVLCFASWPVYHRLYIWCRGRRTLVAFLMTFGMILIVLVPFLVIGITLAESVKELAAATRQWMSSGPPAPPEWVSKIPWIGPQAAEYWQSLAHDTAKLWSEARRIIEPASAWLLRAGLGIGSGLIELALSIFIAFFLFRSGGAIAGRLAHTVQRIGGDRGRHLLQVAGNTVRGVVYGILGTALVQAVIAGIGFLIAGVPGPGLLALLTFFVSVVPVVGTGLVWIPAALWLFHQGSIGWAIFMVAWGVGVGSIDNLVKPWLISQGSDLPFLLIFFGVIGGALAFGLIGVFLGPTLLAVGFRLVQEWNAASPVQPAADTAPSPAVTTAER